MHALGPDDGEQTSEQRVNAGEQAEHDDEKQQRVHAQDRRARREAQDAAQHISRRVKRHAHVDDDGREQGNDRQDIPAGAVEAALQKIRQGGDFRAEIKRREKKREQDERGTCHPLEVAEHQPVFVGRFREADQMHGGDVRREHRQPDHRPAQRVAGQEVMPAFAAAFASAVDGACEHSQAHDREEIKDDDRPIRRVDGSVHVRFEAAGAGGRGRVLFLSGGEAVE